jgi:hypothetical protein
LRKERINEGVFIGTRKGSRGVRATARTSKSGKTIQNGILMSMTDLEFQLIRSHLEYVELPSHRSLHEPHGLFKFAYFPNAGLISIVVVLSDGKTVEAGLIGKEGISGLPAIGGRRRSPLREVVQISGDGFRVRISRLRRLLKSAPTLDGTLRRYTLVFGMQVAQTAACNRLHDIERRLSRWLLMAMDRVDSGLLRITHDFLATMLGTDRSSVTIAAGILQEMKIIEYSRGIVRILDRPQLESYACECYRVIHDYSGDRGWSRT